MDDTGGIAAQNVVQYDPLAACLQRKARLSESKYFLIADSYSKPFTGSPKVLLITTQGRPAHLTCEQTIARIIIPRPRSWRKGQLLPLSGQNASLRTNKTSRHPFSGRQPACGSSWRFFLCRSLRRERTRMAGIHFSSYKANVSFSPFAL